MDIKKVVQVIWIILLSGFSTLLILMAYFGSGFKNIPLITGVLLLFWLPALSKIKWFKVFMGGINIKSIDLKKICIALVTFLLIMKPIGGFFYQIIYPEKIEERKEHLNNSMQQFLLFPNTEKISEEYFRRSFAQTYAIKYRYKVKENDIQRFYSSEVRRLGYKVRKEGENSIEALKNGIVVSIQWGDGSVLIHMEFDDIYQRLAI